MFVRQNMKSPTATENNLRLNCRVNFNLSFKSFAYLTNNYDPITCSSSGICRQSGFQRQGFGEGLLTILELLSGAFALIIDFYSNRRLANRLGDPWVHQRQRPRRNRKGPAIREMVRENLVTPSNFIYPLFIHEEDYKQEISSMPDCFRHSLTTMMLEVEEAIQYGVKTFILFPKVPESLKTNYGEEAYNPNGIVPRALGMIKSKFPDVLVCTDIALDPYSNQGHDGVVKDGKILNDVTIMQLQKQAVMQARAGSDVVAPSDMMDGRI
eukprot:gene13692-29110_t